MKSQEFITEAPTLRTEEEEVMRYLQQAKKKLARAGKDLDITNVRNLKGLLKAVEKRRDQYVGYPDEAIVELAVLGQLKKYGITYTGISPAAFKQIKDNYIRKYAQDANAGPISKYIRIDKALQEPTISMTPLKSTLTGPGGTAKNWKDGVEELGKWLPLRKKALPKTLKTIEEQYATKGYKIKWGDMAWMFLPAETRYGADIVLGAEMMVNGKASNGDKLTYFYNNTAYAESGSRNLYIDGKNNRLRLKGSDLNNFSSQIK